MTTIEAITMSSWKSWRLCTIRKPTPSLAASSSTATSAIQALESPRRSPVARLGSADGTISRLSVCQGENR